jgi:hypothetical protein
MDESSHHRETVAAASVFVLATTVMIVLIWRLVTSPSVTVMVDGELVHSGTLQSPFRFRLVDVVVLTLATFVSGSSAAVLLRTHRHTSSSVTDPTQHRSETSDDEEHAPTPTNELLEARRAEWEESADSLANTERVVYETVLDADGVLPQSEIVENTEFSKATVSRALDTLEARNLIERKRRGVGNVIILQ